MIRELQDLPTGRYQRDFLDSLVGSGNYTIKSAKLSDLAKDGKLLAEVIEILMKDQNLSLASVTDEKVNLLWIHQYPGWMAFCRPLGINIKPSPKIAKRLTVFFRLAYLTVTRKVGTLNARVVTVDDYRHTGLDEDTIIKMLDGANVVSKELLEEMITAGREKVERIFKSAPAGKEGNAWLVDEYTKRIDTAGSFSIRFLCPNGQGKGDCIVSTREAMGGYDLLIFEDNIKGEVKSLKHEHLLLEPHPRSTGHVVYSDDQSISWLGEWLFPAEQLMDTMMDLVDITYNALCEGKWPKFFTAVDLLDDPTKTLSSFQRQMLLFEDQGLGLQSSIFLKDRISQGIISSISSKRRFPVPCAMFAHVATDAWLHLAGQPDELWPTGDGVTPRGAVWYCERFDRLIYNDLDFVELYERHGGWDLDDTVKAHARTWRGEKKWVLVRSPNSYGEYDIKDYIEGTYAPQWEKADGSIVEFPAIAPERPPFLEELDIEYTGKGSLSCKTDQPVRYERYQVVDALKRSISFLGVFGRRANAQMVRDHALPDYRRKQLTCIEEIVDACTQEQTDDARELIDADTKAIIDEIIASGEPVDRLFWQQRIGKLHPKVPYTTSKSFSRLTGYHQSVCSLAINRYFQLSQSAVEHLPEELFELGKPYRKNGKKLYNLFFQESMKYNNDSEVTRQQFYANINDKLCNVLMPLEEWKRHSNVLSLARECYTRKRGNRFRDTMLFLTSDHWTKPSMYELYIEAIQFFGLNSDDWFETAHCPECNTLKVYESPVQFQRHLITGSCEAH